MNKFLLLFIFLPVLAFSQNKSAGTTNVSAPVPGTFTINGTVSGYPEGTVVDLLNANNGQPESTGKLENGKFSFTGKLEFPDFKLLSFNKTGPYITLFLDNSMVSLSAAKDALDQAVVTGSKTNDDFVAFNKVVKPYEKLFAPEGSTDSVTMKKAASLIEAFVKQHTKSYISPLGIYRINQLTDDSERMERLFALLDPQVQTSPIGNYITQMITDAKKNPMGKVMPDFTQPDTEGKAVSLSSFRGKYVLIDFWASWCGPCRQENPNVVSAYNRYKSKNFTVLGVSLDKTKQPWLDAITKDGLAWTNVSDLKFWNNAVAQQFQIQSIPQNFLVDPSGVVIGKNLRGAALESKLASVLK